MSSESDSERTEVRKRSASDIAELPQKRYYRQRAHANPLNDHTFE